MKNNNCFCDFVQSSASSALRRDVNQTFHKSECMMHEQDTRRDVTNSFDANCGKSFIKNQSRLSDKTDT